MSCNDNQSFCLTDQTLGGNLANIINTDEILTELLSEKENPLDFLSNSGRITVNIWNVLEKIFKATNAYGDYGDRNYPAMENDQIIGWPDIQQFNYITPEAYNNIVNIVKESNSLTDFNTVKKNSIILGEYFTDLQTYIENFKIDSNRCNSCNTSCYSNYSCSQGCGEVCDYGNQCVGSYSCYQGCTGSADCAQSCGSCQGGCQTCYSCQGGYCDSCNIGCYSGYSCNYDY